MRKSNSIKNIVASGIQNISMIIIGLISQALFVKMLNLEYLGINGLFTNIISMLSIVELGIGNAITYNLYKPLANNKKEEIKSLLNFYKKTYYIIAFFVFLIGIFIIPFLSNIVGDLKINVNIYIIYFLFLFDAIISYLLSYKRSILYADQKNYIINFIHLICVVALNISQIIVLYITKNFYFYLILKIILKFLENVIINKIVNKLYPFLLEKEIKPIKKSIRKDIFSSIKALFFHQIGGFVVNGTDNILISKYFSVKIVGLYSNYYLIINSVTQLFGQIIDAITPSIGNMLVTESIEKNFLMFKRIRFINFWISTITSICILVAANNFIIIWLGKEYLLSETILFVLVFNYFQSMMRKSYYSFKNVAGLFCEDKFIPIIESLINIFVSIFLLKRIGLVGVFIGTTISGLTLWCYSYPKIIYKGLFKQNYKNYIKETLGYIFLFSFLLIAVYNIVNLFNFKNVFILLIVQTSVSLIISNIILFLIFHKTENYKYLKSFLVEILNKFKHI